MIKLDSSKSRLLFGICSRCNIKRANWWIEELDEYWCSDCRDYLLEIDPWIIEDRKKEKELHKCKCHDEQILIDYKTIVKADRMLFMVGEHGKVVVDDDIRKDMIKTASNLRKIYMNEKGE